ncbi:GNAT family N-acetyltransferase [Paenibacillus chibensis]|uniref:GNAT family N-acetyltransferase n=1 Tax=Paenibacillus chibensis TaxID=59846 RepID=A0ABU6PQW0_9BACL|nr:GNAT family N-acetyltransferase [Paenibacillus chibensis]
MQIRKATPDDNPFLFEVYASTRMDEVKGWGWSEQELQSFLSMQWIMQTRSYQIHYPQAANYIISHLQKPAGRFIVNNSPNSMTLIDISLLPASRNLGIGSSILQMLQTEASDSKIPLFLSVNPLNPAVKLYERLGFIASRKSELYWEMVWNPLKRFR